VDEPTHLRNCVCPEPLHTHVCTYTFDLHMRDSSMMIQFRTPTRIYHGRQGQESCSPPLNVGVCQPLFLLLPCFFFSNPCFFFCRCRPSELGWAPCGQCRKLTCAKKLHPHDLLPCLHVRTLLCTKSKQLNHKTKAAEAVRNQVASNRVSQQKRFLRFRLCGRLLRGP
jgi:hypothetical protein